MAKIRMGFVSNSSSSSFVVAFPKGMEVTEANVHDYLYGELSVIASFDEGIRSERAAELIFEQMRTQQPNDEQKIKDAMSGWLDNAPAYPHRDYCNAHHEWYCDDAECRAQHKQRVAEYHAACDVFRDNLIVEFKTDVDTSKYDLYVFSFSDNDGMEERVLEHGDTFGKVKHMVSSHH